MTVCISYKHPPPINYRLFISEEGSANDSRGDEDASGAVLSAQKLDGERQLRKSMVHFLYCKSMACTSYVFVCFSAIELHIDRRSTLADLKTRLEEYVQIPSSEFKVSSSPKVVIKTIGQF